MQTNTFGLNKSVIFISIVVFRPILLTETKTTRLLQHVTVNEQLKFPVTKVNTKDKSIEALL